MLFILFEFGIADTQFFLDSDGADNVAIRTLARAALPCSQRLRQDQNDKGIQNHGFYCKHLPPAHLHTEAGKCPSAHQLNVACPCEGPGNYISNIEIKAGIHLG